MTALDHMWERREGNGGGNEERSKSCRFLEFLVGWKYNIYVSTSITSYHTFTPDVAISLICNCIWLLSLVLKLFDDGIPGVECVFNRESLKRSFRLLGTFFWRQKLLSPSRRYHSMSPAGRQILQFYNDLIKWWLIPGEPIANDTIQLTCHNSCNHLTRDKTHTNATYATHYNSYKVCNSMRPTQVPNPPIAMQLVPLFRFFAQGTYPVTNVPRRPFHINPT